jgi:uncharacterized membrane protein
MGQIKSKKNKTQAIDKRILLAISFIITAIALSILFYNYLPEKMITHWGPYGEPNGFTDKTLALAIVPGIMVIIAIVLYYLPNLDPLKANVTKFRKEYNSFITIITAFLLYMHIITLSINLGLTLNIIQLLSPAFAALFYSIGTLMQKTKRNFFIGIRTPWTLSSDKVWDKTHNEGGKLFKYSGVICLGGIIFPAYAIFFILAPIIISSIYAVIYSYIEYKKTK